MKEIQVNEYIRTKDGVIAKVTATGYDLDCDRDVFDLKGLSMMEIPSEYVQEYVKKHSFNIKELVEKGDFVNGYEVDEYDGYDEEGNYFENDLGIPIYDDANMECIVEYKPISLIKIKSIVTKEQFKAMEYVIKEE